MKAFFHIRRFDGQLELDNFGRSVAADLILAEAMSGARGLVREAAQQRLPLNYRQFEVRSEGGASLLDFPFEEAIKSEVMNADETTSTDLPYLVGLLGQAWAPQPPKVLSDRIQALAKRGVSYPETMKPRDIMEVCASVIAYGVEQRK